MCATTGEGPLAGDVVVKIENLSFTYSSGDRPALSNINLEISRGEYLGIMGLNGAGKTTLGLSINGIVPQSTMGIYEGQVTVEGLDTSTTPVREMARTVGIVFDNPEFQMSQVSAAEEVALGLENLGVPNKEMPPRVSEALTTVGLAGFEERSPMGLSGGQQQRLAIASVLAMQPRILFMDEPTSNLDPIGKEEVFELARKLNREEGLTVYRCRARIRGACRLCRSHRGVARREDRDGRHADRSLLARRRTRQDRYSRAAGNRPSPRSLKVWGEEFAGHDC